MNKEKKSSYALQLFIIGILFFVFGFVTWLNGILIPYLKIACQLNNFESYFVAFVFYISYFVMAIPSSFILKKTGFKNGMGLGLLIMSAGALMFIPAALTRQYMLFLSGLFVIGTGLTILQTASNPYITMLGPIESAAKRIGIMGICNKVAGVIGPLILGTIVLQNSDAIIEQIKIATVAEQNLILSDLASRVIFPYTIMAVILVMLAALTRFSNLPDIDAKEENEQSDKNLHSTKTSILQYPQIVLGVIALFLYVGVEVLAGDTIISYGKSQGIALSEAKIFTSYTMLAMVIGYIVGIIAIPRFVKQHTALWVSAVIGLLFSICAILTTGFTSVLFIAMLGFANSMMWPAIWPIAIDGLGKYVKLGSSLLIMAIAGGAVLPLVYGRLADVSSPQLAYWIMIPAYIFIFYFAIFGAKKKYF